MRGRFIILILMFVSLCACGSKVDDSQFNEQPVSQQTEMRFSTVQKVEEYFEDNSAEFVKLDIPNCICYALYYSRLRILAVSPLRQLC